jgi:hypothetical protein
LAAAILALENRPDGEGMGNNPIRINGLDVNPADDGYIIYQPELDRVHYLNATAVLILELCTGTNSREEIIGLVQQAYGLAEPPVEAVSEALKQLKDEGLLL